MNLIEAKQKLREHGYKLLKETRRSGMDFESFMNDNKIKALYNLAVKEKKKNDKELISHGCDPDDYDSVWNFMDDICDSYYEKLGDAVNAFLGEDKIDIYSKLSIVKVETDNNYYKFDACIGKWDNMDSYYSTDLGTDRQDPAEFFKTIFIIATEK